MDAKKSVKKSRCHLELVERSCKTLCILAFVLLCVAPIAAFAQQEIPTAGKPINLSIGIGGVRQVSDLPQYIGVLYKWFVGAAMVIAAFMITLGGFQYVASAGIPKYVGMAKQRIINGLMGLLLVIGSYVLLNSINPAFTQLKLPDIRKIQKIDLAVKSCEGYQTKKECNENPQQFKDEGGCVWIEAPTGKCARKAPALGKSNGSPCRTTEPKCDSAMKCVHTTYLGSEGDYCTDGEISSPCIKGSKTVDGGCLVSKEYKCGDLVPRCETSVKKNTGGECIDPSECKSNICFRKQCGDKDHPPLTCAQLVDCDRYPNGEDLICCLSTSTCAVPADVGLCRTKGILGDPCVTPIECLSSVCNRVSKTCLGGLAENCTQASDCASGICEPIEGSVSGEKQCVEKKSEPPITPPASESTPPPTP